MSFFEKDFRVKITAILLALVLIALVASLVVSYFFITRITRDNVEESMLESARMTSNLLEVGLERREGRISLLAGYPELKDPTSDITLKGAILDLFITTWPIGEGAMLTDTGGNVLYGTGNLGTIGNVSGTDWFDYAQTAHISFTYIHEPLELTTIFFGAPMLSVSSPVRDEKGQIHSYVVAFTTLSDIRQAIVSVNIKETGHAFLVDGTGEIVAGTLFGPRMSPTDEEMESIETLLDDMTRGYSGNTTIEYKGKKYLVTYTTVQPTIAKRAGLDWAVGVVVPEGEAYAPARKVAWVLIGLIAIVLLGSAFAAFFLGRSISRPINELVSSAERIGSGDLTGDVAIRTRDQIGTLAAALLRMRDYLRSTLGEAGFSSDRMAVLADEQSAATQDVFSNIEEIVESVIVLSKNADTQTRKIREILSRIENLPEDVRGTPDFKKAMELLQESEILAEVGASKAVEIASAAQQQRAAARDVTAASRRLSDMAEELKEMVRKFKV